MQRGILDGSLEEKEDPREKTSKIQIKSVHCEWLCLQGIATFLVEINVMKAVNLRGSWVGGLWGLSYYLDSSFVNLKLFQNKNLNA